MAIRVATPLANSALGGDGGEDMGPESATWCKKRLNFVGCFTLQRRQDMAVHVHRQADLAVT